MTGRTMTDSPKILPCAYCSQYQGQPGGRALLTDDPMDAYPISVRIASAKAKVKAMGLKGRRRD